MKTGYQCENCGKFSESKTRDAYSENVPWLCPVCGKEACQYCYEKYATHKECCIGKTDDELMDLAQEKGWNFRNR